MQREREGEIYIYIYNKKAREWKGGVKKVREKQRETLKKQAKIPLFRGKTGFGASKRRTKTKETIQGEKATKTNKTTTNMKINKTNKEGLGPSEVALRATSAGS